MVQHSHSAILRAGVNLTARPAESVYETVNQAGPGWVSAPGDTHRNFFGVCRLPTDVGQKGAYGLQMLHREVSGAPEPGLYGEQGSVYTSKRAQSVCSRLMDTTTPFGLVCTKPKQTAILLFRSASSTRSAPRHLCRAWTW